MAESLIAHPLALLARGLDRAFANTALRPAASSGRSLDHAERLRALALMRAFYDTQEALEREGRFFPRPSLPVAQRRRVRSLARGGELIDLRWESAFEPLWSVPELQTRLERWPDTELRALGLSIPIDAEAELEKLGIDRSAGLRDKYLRVRNNRVAHARWFRHAGEPRACAVLLHGYLGGNFALEQYVLPVRRLYDAGLDVVLSLLPLHGPRRSELRNGWAAPAFPSNDPRFTIEGFRQLVSDQRALFGLLRAEGAPRLGVLGASLGGYSAALLATLEASLDFAVLFIPLAAIEDVAHSTRRAGDAEPERAALREALRAAQRPISPLSRPSLVAPERVVVVAGESDLITGLAQAELLAAHFGVPVSRFAGGHVLHVGRERAFAPVWALVEAAAARGVGQR